MKILFSLLITLCLVNPCWGGVDFDKASTDYIESNDVTLGATLANFSVSLWYQRNNSATITVDELFLGSFDTGWNRNLQIWLNESDDDFRVKVSEDASGTKALEAQMQVDQNTAGYLADGSVHHLFISVDIPNNDIQVWIDGSEKSMTITEDSNPTNWVDFEFEWYFGGGNCGGAGAPSECAHVDGWISDLYIWSDEQDSLAPIIYSSKVKNIALQLSPSTLIFCYPLDDVADGVSIAGATFVNLCGVDATGVTGDGMAEKVLSYP